MERDTFIWSSQLAKKLFQLRFDNEWLFKNKKRAWGEFYKILLDNGFPKEMTINHVRKKWSYTYDSYRLAKKSKNKHWKYYKMFDKHYGKSVLDKYDSWNDEWRLKLITGILEAKVHKFDTRSMWRTVESAMRSQDLPLDCCIHDMQGLWHYIKITFKRKHRVYYKKGIECDWPLYNIMLEYIKKFPHEDLLKEENKLSYGFLGKNYFVNDVKGSRGVDKTCSNDDLEEFQWSKDITESFVQIRLQHDWLFRDKKWKAWNDMRTIMVKEYGFPKYLTSKDISKKWSSTYSDYQKAIATNNRSWVYYNLFELYLGDGNLSLNPLIGWQEEWVANLISVRSELEPYFGPDHARDRNRSWREVEKRLREMGLPLDHSLLDLDEIWSHLMRTYRWKKKFASKGMLSEPWPYFAAMEHYVDKIYTKAVSVKLKPENVDEGYDDNSADVSNNIADINDEEDDMKLFDLKQKLQLDVKREQTELIANQCRSCGNEDGCVNIFDQKQTRNELDLAEKLRLVGGVMVDKADHLPSQICLACLQELENAYKFRRKCQEIDKDLRNVKLNMIKIEICESKGDNNYSDKVNNDFNDNKTNDYVEIGHNFDSYKDDHDAGCDVEFINDLDSKNMSKVKHEKAVKPVNRRRKKERKTRYDYWKICEVCGKPTRNLISHLDAHSVGKSYSCEVCDKKFKFKSGLIIHRAVHDAVPKKTCDVCGKTFHILAHYRRHYVYHANERKFECETCGKRFNTLDILRVHIRMHTNERPFSCGDCGKTFRTAGCVSRHRRIVHRLISNFVEQNKYLVTVVQSLD